MKPAIGEYSLGRDPERDLPLDDPLASRVHARLYRDKEEWVLADCNKRETPRIIQHCNQVTPRLGTLLANVLCRFDLANPADATWGYTETRSSRTAGRFSAMVRWPEGWTARILADGYSSDCLSLRAAPLARGAGDTAWHEHVFL